MIPRRTRLNAALAATATVLVSIGITGTAGAASAALTSPGSAGAAGSRSYAQAPADTAPMDLTIVLTPSSRGQLKSLARRKTKETRQQRAADVAKTAPSAASLATVRATLTAAGFVVKRVGGWDLKVSGTPAQIEGFFAVKFLGSRATRHADRRPTLPAAFAGRVTAVLGLDQRAIFHRRTIPLPGFTPAYGASPADLRSAYAAPAGAKGLGTKVATIQFSGWNDADLTNYATAVTKADPSFPIRDPIAAGLYNEVSVDSANPRVTDGNHGDLEVSLDQEMILAAAPEASQRAYFAPNSAAGSYDMYTQVADDVPSQNITTISTSWGFCQSADSPNFGYENAIADAISRAVAAGATTFAAAGDSGADDCALDGTSSQHMVNPDVDFPAAMPEVVAVGGTSLKKSGSTWTESVWNDAPNARDNGGATGGGFSHSTPRPAYQQSISVADPNAANQRLVPDISATADFRGGYAPYAYNSGEGGDTRVGGTSVGAPLMAGLLAARLSGLDCASGIGDIHQTLYSHADASHFRDVVSGNNTYPPGNAAGFAAAAGYDMVSGLGSPQWSGFTDTELLNGGACPPSTYAALPLPARILDTRTGNGAPKVAVTPGATVHLQVTGRPGVPSSGVGAVVVNVTVTAPTGNGFITVYPTGPAPPTASNLNFSRGQTIPNLVVVKVGSGGQIDLYNGSSGSVQLIADVAGYYASGTASVPGTYAPLTPSRILDTRTGNGAPKVAVAPGATVHLQVTGRPGVPSGVGAVVVNVTVTVPTGNGFITVYPTGPAERPTASNLNFSRGQTIPNLAVVKVGSGGQIDLYNGSSGSVQLIADVAGYYASGTASAPGTYDPLTPSRILDTRTGDGAAKAAVAPGATVHLQVTGSGGVPSSGVGAVVVNVTVTAPTGNGFITVYPTGPAPPAASNLNFSRGQTIPNLAVVKVGSGGQIELYNGSSGSVQLIADVAGYDLT